jgi:hypothetical protein
VPLTPVKCFLMLWPFTTGVVETPILTCTVPLTLASNLFQWFFDCNCPRCEDPTEFGSNLAALLCQRGGHAINLDIEVCISPILLKKKSYITTFLMYKNYMKSKHRVGRVQSFFCSCRNWADPSPHPQARVCPPLLGSWGGNTR